MIEEKEVRLLIKGQEFTGEFQGVSYEIGVYWDEDWCVRVDIVSFKPLPHSHTYFWLNKMPEQIVEEYLYDAIYKLPEVLEFQKRIDAMGEVSQDALDDIIEKLENEE
tara:strand:+ start:1339 stop:1662 length:324 start_codon:yes stop_codon:yes gene_type:complete